ncbi:hypothetical protein L596_004431 [Steinernema carpocapsae]|uniref:Uncharacterized protein n=1 Tax=Steinernema carpocapsae TaxID=34508 RepID=A0A4U8UZW8_STECR|nr:hypothetical protein L596_004431 [Steinernema carpocapsae]
MLTLCQSSKIRVHWPSVPTAGNVSASPATLPSSAPLTTHYTGPTACLNKCCCTVPNPQPPPDLFDFCPDGFQSSIRCSAAGQCSQGQICMNGLCCRLTGQEYLYACGGERALSSCTNGMCNQGFACVPSNYCCECPVGRKGGSCWNGQPCAPGFFCQPNGYCCASCPGNQTPLGTCTNGQCGGERRCMPGNICC